MTVGNFKCIPAYTGAYAYMHTVGNFTRIYAYTVIFENVLTFIKNNLHHSYSQFFSSQLLLPNFESAVIQFWRKYDVILPHAIICCGR